MQKLNLQTQNLAEEKFAALAEMFPGVVTETIVTNDAGEEATVRAIDAAKLQEEINTRVLDSNEQRYQFTWPDKRKAAHLANEPIDKTLRPCREESVNFDSTENLYIEGDNLDVLKLLRETYLGKVKMIYIDPPYNTGNDFVYEDDFAMDREDWAEVSGDYDEQGNRLVKNLESNGRFHTDWLNMIYPRLRLARDLLTDDGVIFISIDDNEQANLAKILNEVFGESNKVAELVVIRAEGGGLAKQVIKGHDYLFVYSKDISKFTPLGRQKDIRGKIIKKNGDEFWIQEDWLRKEFGKYGNCHYEEILEFKDERTKKIVDEKIASGEYILIPKENGMNIVGKLRKINEDASKFYSILKHLSANGVKDMQNLNLSQYFDYPKPVSLIKELTLGATFFSRNKNDIILDFFSGSATTAHAVMQLNAEDGGNRKFIMVQIDEETDEKSEAYKAGYKNICEIGKERIRRAGKKLSVGEKLSVDSDQLAVELETENCPLTTDIGFRVLKLDESNMKDVYYSPEEFAQGELNLDELVDNIKADRSDEDLLFQVMLDLGIELSAKITRDERGVLYVEDNYLIACFGEATMDIVTEIAKRKPQFAIFRDSSFDKDSTLVNFEQVFRTYSPDTERRVV